jgi:diguanylate cyclase (GGDEF)-like protein
MANSVLIIDDSELIREQIVKTLESRDLFSRFYQAEDGLEGFKKLLASPVDIVLCDLEMPRMDGFKFLGMLKGRSDVADTPVILLTGNDDRELKLKGLEQGACDFLTKPFDPEELVARMRVHLKIKHLQDDLKRSNELLLELSNTDHLTGLFNRRFLMESLDKEVQRASRKDGQVALLMLDIDHFKRINDNYGHLQGDVVLQKVSLHIQRELRNYDIAARYGGEEFVAVLPDTTLKEAFHVADRIRLSVQGMCFAGALAKEQITASLGVATFPSPCYDDIDGLLRAADEALYQAKEEGRNRVVISDPVCRSARVGKSELKSAV